MDFVHDVTRHVEWSFYCNKQSQDLYNVSYAHLPILVTGILTPGYNESLCFSLSSFFLLFLILD